MGALGLIGVLGPRLRGDDALAAAGSRPGTPGRRDGGGTEGAGRESNRSDGGPGRWEGRGGPGALGVVAAAGSPFDRLRARMRGVR